MRTLTLVALAAALLVGPPARADERTVAKPYAAPGANAFGVCTLTGLAIGEDSELGGACFTLEGDEQSVSVTVDDDLFPGVGGYYYFLEVPDGPAGFFCGTTGPIAIPSGAAHFTVAVDVEAAVLFCQAPPSTGTITATFVTEPVTARSS